MATLRVASSFLPGSVSTSWNVFNVSETEGARCLADTNYRWTEFTKTNNTRCNVSTSPGCRSLLRRPRLVRAASEKLTVAESLNDARQRESLKKKLMLQIIAASGNLTEDCIATIKELGKFNPNPESLNDPELHAGYWERVKAGHLGTGRKGEAKVEVGYEGAPATLGRAAFNAFKPAELPIVMGEVFNYIPKIGVEGENKYAIFIEFTTKNPKGHDLPLIEGLIINGAMVKIENSSKMRVLFDETKLRPSYPERDLEAWKELFEEASGRKMNEMGEITVTNKNAAAGFLDIIYIDDELRISKGNLGSYVVVRRMGEPPKFVNETVW